MTKIETRIANQIISLQASFGKLDKIDPTGPLATKMRAAMDKIESADALRLICAANIKFVSNLALVRLVLRGERA